MIQACPDEPLVDEKEGVSRKNRNLCLFICGEEGGWS